MKKTFVLFLGLFLLVLRSLVFPVLIHSSGPNKTFPAEPFSLEVRDGLISIHAINTNFKHILNKLAKEAKIAFDIHEKVEDKEVSLTVQNLSFFALGSLLEMMEVHNYAVTFDPYLKTEIMKKSKESAPIGCGFEIAPHRGAQVVPQLGLL